MTNLEKELTALISNAPAMPYYKIVDYLIANGVTMQNQDILRCKDCRHHEPSDVRNRIWCRNMCRYMKEDGFCSEGVKED